MRDVAEIAASLTEAQRAYLGDRAEWRRPTTYDSPCAMTFPPPNTHRVLIRLGLVNDFGQITETGLAVRAHLENSHD